MIKENIWSFSNTKKSQAERRQIEPIQAYSFDSPLSGDLKVTLYSFE